MSRASQLAEAPARSTSSEGRREKRYPAQTGVKLSLQVLPDGKPEEAELKDISLHGFGISVSHFIEPGTQVVIRTRKQRIDAEIIYCRADKDRYRAGITVHHAERELAAPKQKRNWDSLLAGSRSR